MKILVIALSVVLGLVYFIAEIIGAYTGYAAALVTAQLIFGVLIIFLLVVGVCKLIEIARRQDK